MSSFTSTFDKFLQITLFKVVEVSMTLVILIDTYQVILSLDCANIIIFIYKDV